MTILLFVHGTGVREHAYQATLALIEEKVSQLDASLSIRGCYWGSTHGAMLGKELLSVPTYLDTGGETPSEEERTIGLWTILYTDPYYELRLLRLKPIGVQPFGPAPGPALIKQLKQYSPSPELTAKFDTVGLGSHLPSAVAEIAGSTELAKAAETAPAQPLEHRQALARSIVAQTIVTAEAKGIPTIDGSQREELVTAIESELQARGLGVGTWLKDAVTTLASHIATRKLVADRGGVTDAASPSAGDTLRFLAYPREVTDLLRETLADLAGERVVLLAHSLGGIMCLDLLARETMPQVEGLITVGSQAPYLYEIGALPSVRPGAPLPDRVPRWLNIYDLRDTLSYVGAGVFPGRVTDVEVDNGQPFPQSHSAYWNNPATWTRVSGFLGS